MELCSTFTSEVSAIASNFLICGDPWRQISLCEKDAAPGDVVLSPEVWNRTHESVRTKELASGNRLLLEVVDGIPSKAVPALPIAREIANHLAQPWY